MLRMKMIVRTRCLLAAAVISFLAVASVTAAGDVKENSGGEPAYRNPKLPVEQRVADLISRMTLEEKVSQMGDKAPAVERLGIPEYKWWSECLHGVMGSNVTVFPQAIGLSATWNPQLIYDMAGAISDEARVKYREKTDDRRAGGLTYWSPVVNIGRDPRWGRTQEGYGEDPYLVSRIGVAFVKGLQGNDPKYLKVVSTPKHFAANNEESRRHTGSSDVDEQLLREYYLPHFKACVVEGKAYSVMCAYNALNNIPCCCNNTLLTNILRDEWGFEGYVVSDCGAIRDIHANHRYLPTPEEAAAAGVKAGTDLNCGRVYQEHLIKAVKKGLLAEKEIDKALGRLFKARFLLGMFDPPEIVPYSKIPSDVVDCERHRRLALQTARESIVLLKNEAGLLPLDRAKIKSIAVIGPNADVLEFGNYTGTPTKAVNVLEGIKGKVGSKIEVGFAKGCEIAYLPVVSSEYLVPAGTEKDQPGLRGEYFSNRDLSGEPVLVRIDKAIDFDWGEGSPDKNVPADGFSIRWTGKLIAPVSGVCKLNLTAHRGTRLYIDGKPVIDRWGGWRLETDVIALKLNKGQEYDIKIEYSGGSRRKGRQNVVSFGWDAIKDEKITKGIEEVVQLAKKSDVAVVVLGINQEIEGESNDRFDMDLPGGQNDLIREIYKANPRTVVVLINGSPLSIGWIKENMPAVVEAWYPGEEGGTAVADVLFGDYNPAGRLSMTFYKSVEQLPPFDDYDIRKGRTYMYLKDQPLFPFGYGLSYTTFEYSGFSIEPKRIGSSGKVNVGVNVRNTGQYDGDEVVQLYVRDVEAGVQRPLKQLVGFERIHLKKGEEKTVRFTLTAESFSYYDVAGGKFIVEPGKFDVMIGASSDDVRAKDSFEVVAPG